MTYQLTNGNTVLRIADNSFIPIDPANIDYMSYLAWLEEGNEPEPAPERYDERFFCESGLLKNHDQLVEQWTSCTYQTANSLLTSTDWMVIREADNGKAVPESIRSWREAIRTAARQKVSAIAATATSEELVAVILAPEFSEWPEKG